MESDDWSAMTLSELLDMFREEKERRMNLIPAICRIIFVTEREEREERARLRKIGMKEDEIEETLRRLREQWEEREEREEKEREERKRLREAWWEIMIMIVAELCAMQEELDLAIGYEEDEKEAELLKQKHGTANDIESNPGPPVANLDWMGKFVTMDQDRQRGSCRMLIRNIISLHEALKGEIPLNLYNEENLSILNDIYFLYIKKENYEEKIRVKAEDLALHWLEKLDEFEEQERNAKNRNIEGDEEKAEGSEENEKEQHSQVDHETIVVNTASATENDDEEAEAIPGDAPAKDTNGESDATITRKNDDEEDEAAPPGENYQNILVSDEPNERKRKNTPSKENSKEQGTKRRKTQDEVKQGRHWACDLCHRGFVRVGGCKDHIKNYHKGNAKAVEKQGQEPTDTQTLAKQVENTTTTQGPATDPDHPQITNGPDDHQLENPTLPTPTEGPATDDHLPGAVLPSAQLPLEPVQIELYLDPAHQQQPQPSTSQYYEAPDFADVFDMIHLEQLRFK